MVSVFAGNSPLPTTKMKALMMNIATKFIFAKAIKKKKIKRERLIFIDKNILSNLFDWANSVPEIKKEFEYFEYQTENEIDKILMPELISLLKNLAANLELLKPAF